MKAHLKNIEGVMPIVSQLRVLCGEHIEVNTFSNFIQVEIKTGLESHIGAIFSEEGYETGNYRICVYDRNEHENEINIPLKFIDCLFGL